MKIEKRLAGLRRQARNRLTGDRVSIYLAEEAGLDPAGGRWATVCEAHGTIINHETRRLADHHLTDFVNWCQDCAALAAREGAKMKVCDLTNGFELHADALGTPYKIYPYPSADQLPMERISEIGEFVAEEDKQLVNAWQADPNHDNLRTRGDPRWQAACSFTQRPTW